jgi:hypothetical protein
MPIGQRWSALHDGWICSGRSAATEFATGGGPSPRAVTDVPVAWRNLPS